MTERIIAYATSHPLGIASFDNQRGHRFVTWPEMEAQQLLGFWSASANSVNANQAGDYIIELAERIKAARAVATNSMLVETMFKARADLVK